MALRRAPGQRFGDLLGPLAARQPLPHLCFEIVRVLALDFGVRTGHDNHDLLSELGYTDDEIASLEREGIIGNVPVM